MADVGITGLVSTGLRGVPSDGLSCGSFRWAKRCLGHVLPRYARSECHRDSVTPGARSCAAGDFYASLLSAAEDVEDRLRVIKRDVADVEERLRRLAEAYPG
jgi:hypothetical protein